MKLFAILNSKFVPKYNTIGDYDFAKINNFVQNSKKLFVLTGAGISTESGIPDYRSEKVGLYARSNHKPIEHQEFLKSSERRRIYWARNYVSWPIFSSFRPNITHLTLADWEKKRKVFHHVTQNVDGLFKKAGCLRLTELHGSSYKVKCVDCSFRLTREAMQILIQSENPDWFVYTNEINPDNDVVLTDEAIESFKLPVCPSCKGDRLKPELVFFGDNIAKDLVENIYYLLAQCDGLLAMGTSLQVYSAYRFILKAHEQGTPIAIVNIGDTRADKYATLKINTLCSDVIKRITI